MPNKKINQLTPRTPTLTDLILVGDPATGYSYKATLSAMINFVGGNIQFSSLGGISLTNPTNGQVLTFNGTNWVNQTPASAPVSSVFGRTGAVVAAEGDYSLTQLSDVTISSPTNGQVLKYNGTAWVNDSDTDTGITSLNGLTATTQTFATGSSGTDFTISSTTSTHTFNLPTASSSNRGLLSSADWSTFNAKQNTITLTTTGNSGSATFVSDTLNIPTYTLAGLGGISLSSLSASAPLSYNSGTGAFSITQASGSTNGFLSSTDWTTFNNKQSTITLTTTGSSGASTFISNTLNIPTYTLAGLGGVSGSGTTNYVPKWTGSSALGNSQIFDNGTNVGIGTTSVSNVASERVLQLNALSFSTFRLRNDANTVTTILSNNASGWGYVGTETNHPFLFTTNNTEKARLTAAGRLLLGTTTESTFELDVVGDIRSTLDARINGLTVGKGGGSVSTNTAVGVEAINATATGATNTAVGYRALFSLTSGAGNTSIGNQSGRLITTGTRNTGVGYFSLFNLAGGNRNVAIGYESLNGTTSGNYNNAIGDGAGYDVTTGEFNTIVGYNTGRGITTGSNNTIIGGQVSGLSSSLSNTIILADGQGNQRLYIDNIGEVGIGTTSPSSKLHVVTGNVDGIRVESSGSGYLETGKTGGGRYRWANDYTGANMLELQYGAAGATPTTTRMSVFSNGNINVGTNIDQGYNFFVNGTTLIGGTELRLNNATTGVINLYSNTPEIRFFSGDPTGYRLYRSGTAMIWNAGGSINLQISSNDAYSLSAANGHLFKSAISGSATLARLDTGGSLSIGKSNTAAVASSILELSSTTKGFLPPRMTTTQKNAISSPAAGLVVYDTTLNKLCVYTTAWETVTSL